MKWRIKFEPRDLWVGVFWDRRPDGLHVYICPVPTAVLHVVVPVTEPEHQHRWLQHGDSPTHSCPCGETAEFAAGGPVVPVTEGTDRG